MRACRCTRTQDQSRESDRLIATPLPAVGVIVPVFAQVGMQCPIRFGILANRDQQIQIFRCPDGRYFSQPRLERVIEIPQGLAADQAYALVVPPALIMPASARTSRSSIMVSCSDDSSVAGAVD